MSVDLANYWHWPSATYNMNDYTEVPEHEISLLVCIRIYGAFKSAECNLVNGYLFPPDWSSILHVICRTINPEHRAAIINTPCPAFLYIFPIAYSS